MTLSDKEGIKAIIFLQSMGGTKETEEQAAAGWNSMKQWEKESTEKAYKLFAPKAN